MVFNTWNTKNPSRNRTETAAFRKNRIRIPMRLKFLFLLSSIFLFCNFESIAQDSHFGMSYSYGACFNSHHSNNKPFKPSDGSTIGCYYHLDNGLKALGFKATFSWRSNDIEFPIADHLSIMNNLKSLELKLQCVLPVSEKSSFALGMAPRMIFRSKFSKLYFNSSRQTTYEEQIAMNGEGIDLNQLNSALCISWIYRVSKHFHFALNLDQDMLTQFRKDASFTPDADSEPVAFNARLTCLTGSLILNLK